MITQARVKELLDYDSEVGTLRWKRSRGRAKSGDIAGTSNPDGYLYVKLDKISYPCHRIAWLYVFGSFPKDEIDHINRDKTDFRILNLREATRSENSQNKPVRRDSTSRLKGVYFDKRNIRTPWQARISKEGKMTHLGYFETAELASEAYLRAAPLIHTHFST
jgi:hypothetical protein